MNKKTLFPALFLSILLLGCLPSFHPFCTEQMKEAVPELEGKWQVLSHGKQGATKRNPWIFKGNEAIVFDAENRKGLLQVSFFRVDGTLYVDTISGEAQEGINAEWLCHLLPFHDLCKVIVDGDRVEIWGFDYEVFEKGLKDGRLDLPYVKREDLILFTATPQQWTAFLKEKGNEGSLYEEKPLYVLERVKDNL